MNDSWEGRLTVQPSQITEVLNRPISQELLARDLTRLAYVAKDGTPRSIPIGFVWNGSEIVMCTAKNAAKVPALRHNPAVALTIDTEVHPPKILLIRGRAELDVVEGIPDEYLEMNGTYTMTPEQRVEWEAEVRSLYDEPADHAIGRSRSELTTVIITGGRPACWPARPLPDQPSHDLRLEV